MTAERVTVAITNYNGIDHLPPCLDAVRELDYPEVEVMLVDNASTDGSLELVRERYPEVRVLALSTNDGPGPARNAALREAQTDLVLSIDNDAVLTPDCLTRLVGALRERPAVAACMPRTVYDGEPDRIHFDGGDVHYLGMISIRNFRRRLGDTDSRTRETDVLIAVAILFDRSKLDASLVYDESMFIFFEDQDLGHRIRLRGLEILTVSEAIVRHREGTAGVSFREGGSLSERRAYYFTRNRWVLIGKNYSRRSLVLLAPALAVYECVWMLFLIVKGRFASYCRGIRDVWRARPETRRKRAEVQQTRVVRDRELFVGAPLTFAVPDTGKPLQAAVVAMLDLFFKAYWTCVRAFL